MGAVSARVDTVALDLATMTGVAGPFDGLSHVDDGLPETLSVKSDCGGDSVRGSRRSIVNDFHSTI